MEEINRNNGLFHLDATYKIVKYNYPLIVFGFSDLAHRFHPIFFMYTSHETEADYDHFKGNVQFIKKNFPDWNIIMCYYHLKSNIKKK